jgi:ferredoxin-NADP reductase
VVLTVPIREVVPATPRSRIVRFDLDGDTFDFAPGQAVRVGVPGTERRRPYSIASAPEDARTFHALELLVGVDPDGRAGDHLPLEPGTPVEVEGPLGTFTFPDHVVARRIVFVAGGTGIAPLRAMLRHVVASEPGVRDIGLLYSARTPDDFAYEEEFRDLAARGVIELRQTITRADEVEWTGGRGRIDRIALAELVHDPDTLCFVCGPAAMVAEIPRLLTELGVPREKIRIEEW